MQCVKCKETIDDDSRYCDQCGEQIMVCSVCGRPGSGKRCIFDGKEMVPATGVTSATQSVTQNSGASAPSAPSAPSVPSGANSGAISGNKIRLSSPMHGITIEAKDGDIIGRKNGAFADVFGRFNFVSGTHCKIIKTAVGWHIQDMGSTNGTFYNGAKLVPNTPYPLLNGTTVKIADIELTVTYGEAEGGTSRI